MRAVRRNCSASERAAARGCQSGRFLTHLRKEVPTMIRRIKINPYERGLLFREGRFEAVLQPGAHWYLDPLLKLRADVVSTRDPWLVHRDLDLIVKSGKLAGQA